MYGWRGRIGLLVPANNVVIEPELHKALPEGIYAFSTKLLGSSGVTSIEGFKNLMNNTKRGVKEILMAEVDVVVYACFSTSLVNKDWNQEYETIVKQHKDIPCFTAYSATIKAIKHLSIENIAVFSAFTDNINKLLLKSFKEEGLNIEKSLNMNIEDARKVGNLLPEVLYKKIKHAPLGSVEGISILATDLRTFEIIDILEKDLGIPVITTNQAILWEALKALGAAYDTIDYGSLFSLK